MDINSILKRYYLKVALPICLVALFLESAFTPTSYIGSYLSKKVKVGSA